MKTFSYIFLEPGYKVAVAHRRLFETDTPRFFLGIVAAFDQGIVKVHGHSWSPDPIGGGFVRKEGERTKLFSLLAARRIAHRLRASRGDGHGSARHRPRRRRRALADRRQERPHGLQRVGLPETSHISPMLWMKGPASLPKSGVVGRAFTLVKLGSAGRYIPAKVAHQVSLRDRGECTFTGAHGKCRESRWVDVHHLTPVSQGGTSVLDNLTTLCASHHRYLHGLERTHCRYSLRESRSITPARED